MPSTPTIDDLSARGWRSRDLPGYIGLIGPLWTRKGDPNWDYGLLVTQQHLNPAGVVHGGLLTSLIDHALSAIAWEAAGRRPCVTVQLDMQFLAPARQGQFLEASGRVVRATSTLVFMHGHVSVDGCQVASASAVMKLINAAEKPAERAGA